MSDHFLRNGFDHCRLCGNYRFCIGSVCEECFNDSAESGTFDYYDEPMFYDCAMCGMETVSFEVVRGRKYCHSCAATERNG